MNPIAELLSSRSLEPLGWSIVHSIWQLTAIAVLFACCLMIPPLARTANRRYVLACAAMFLMIACPLATWGFLVASMPDATPDNRLAQTRPAETQSDPAPPQLSADDRRRTASTVPGIAPDSSIAVEPPATNSTSIGNYPPEASSASWLGSGFDVRPWLPWVVGCWVCGVIVISMWHLGGWLQIVRIKRAACVAEVEVFSALERLSARVGVRRAVQVLETSRTMVPSVVGWWRPAILLPAGMLAGMPADQVEAVLAHELAHIRRHDFLVNLLQTMAETLLFYHPAVWWVSACVRRERELCADQSAVSACGNRVAYARALTHIADFRNRLHPHTVAMAGGSLKDRIAQILDPAYRPPRRAHVWVVGVSAAMLILSSMMSIAFSDTRNPAPTDSSLSNGRPVARTDTVPKTAESKTTVTVRGQVRLKDSHEPVRGLMISLGERRSPGPRSGNSRTRKMPLLDTDEHGQFEMQLAPGRYELLTMDRATQWLGEIQVKYFMRWGPIGRPFEIRDDEQSIVELDPIEVVPAYGVEARLVDERGEPIAGANVKILHDDGWTFGVPWNFAESDERGELVLKLASRDVESLEEQLQVSVHRERLGYVAKIAQTEPLVIRVPLDQPRKFIPLTEILNKHIRNPENAVANIPGIDMPENAALRATLLRPVDTRFVDMPFEDAVDFLAKQYQVRVRVPAGTQLRERFEPRTTFNLAGRKVVLHAALIAFLAHFDVTYEVKDGEIVVVPR